MIKSYYGWYLAVRFADTALITEKNQMNNHCTHVKKMIAPIVITVIAVIYYMFYFGIIIFEVRNTPWLILLGIVPIGLAVAMIYVCIQRIREIENGEEDDLSKY